MINYVQPKKKERKNIYLNFQTLPFTTLQFLYYCSLFKSNFLVNNKKKGKKCFNISGTNFEKYFFIFFSNLHCKELRDFYLLFFTTIYSLSVNSMFVGQF